MTGHYPSGLYDRVQNSWFHQLWHVVQVVKLQRSPRPSHYHHHVCLLVWCSFYEMLCWFYVRCNCTFWHFSTAWYGTVRFGTVHFWGVFHWVLYLVPGTFLVPPQPRFQAIRTVTKTWRVNSDWLEKIETRDPPLQLYPLDLNQHSQRRIGHNFV